MIPDGRAVAGRALPAVLALLVSACGDGPTSLRPEPEPPTAPPACEAGPTVALDPGGTALLPPGDSLCVRFAAAGRYTLAYVDTATVAAAGVRAAPFLPSDRFSVSVRLHGAGPAGVAPTGPRASGPAPVRGPDAAAPAPHVRVAAPTDCDGGFGSVLCRDRPWAVGDTFRFGTGDPPRAGTVVGVVGPLVLAHWTDELAVMADVEEAFTRLAEEAVASVVPFLRRTLLDEMVTSSPGSGQLLVVARPDDPSIAFSASSSTGSSGVVFLTLKPGVYGTIEELVATRLLAHELAHLWQFRHLYRGSGGAPPWSGTWAVEGGADLVAREYLRRRLGIPLQPNRVERALGPPRTADDVFWNGLHVTRGRLESGYGQSESFLRHLLVRLVRAGADPDDALRTVVLGSAEGWNGQPSAPWAGPGLAGRLDAALPGGWTPVDGVTAWTLANALDDRTGDPALQNHTVARAWEVQDDTGWPPDGSVTADAPFVEVRRRAGSTGYVVVDVPEGADVRVVLVGSGEPYGPPGVEPGPETLRAALRWTVARGG